LEGLHENIKIRAAAHAAFPAVGAAVERQRLPPTTSGAAAPAAAAADTTTIHAQPAPAVALKRVSQSALAASVAQGVPWTRLPGPVLIGSGVAAAALIRWLVVRH